MTPLPTPSAPGVGRLTGLVLGLVVFVCVTMIGLAGYLKYELDRAETELTAPEQVLAPEQDAYEKFRRNLGYSGFVGTAQAYAITHDTDDVPTLKAQLKAANDTITHLSDRTPAEVKHDLQAILGAFDMAMQKIDKSIDAPATGFGPADMAPLYAALPVMDTRITSAAATNRIDAQNRVQFWAMLLTLVTWCSLIIASALAAGIYLTLRDRNSAPLRALAQSVKNMARGDMRTPIWGMERQDTVGDVARSIDMARFQFSQLPDLALLSDQGPVRIRFEGNTRSLFEAMMRVISRNSEKVHEQAAGLTEAINKQQQSIASLTHRVEGLLTGVQKHAAEGDAQLRQSLQSLIGSAQSLKTAQEHAADQLNRIIPYMQERAEGLSEITQITGKQVAQVLQSLTVTSRSLRENADEGDVTMKKLSSAADGLGERLFGAVNLLQASGKVLAETTESARSRLEDVIERLNIRNFGASGFMSNNAMVPEETVQSEFLHRELGNLGEAMAHILGRIDAIGSSLQQQAGGGAEASANEISSRMTELSMMVSALPDKIGMLMPKENSFSREAEFASNIMMEVKTHFEVFGQALDRTREQITAMAISTPADPSNFSAHMRDHWSQIAGQIEATRISLEQSLQQQVTRIEQQLAEAGVHADAAPVMPETIQEAQQQMEQQTQILNELVATLGALDAHMQEIRTQVADIKQKAS